jgi:prepilin-type N-terminal cleavage/methylation domain-containing protein
MKKKISFSRHRNLAHSIESPLCGPSGFSLVELMMAMGISAVVAIGLMAIVENAQRGQKAVSQAVEWSAVQAELQSLFSSGSSCVNIMNYNGFYIPGAAAPGTVVGVMPNNRQITIPRSNPDTTRYFRRDYVESNSTGGQSFKFTDVSLQNATNPGASATQIEVDIQIKVDRSFGNVKSLGAKNGTLSFHLSLIRSIAPGSDYNRLVSCTSNFNAMVAQQNCETMGGVYRSTPPGNEPACLLVLPSPSYVPGAGLYTQPFQNLCPPGQAVSGFDISSGQVLAVCTSSNPISSNIPTCIGGVLTWVSDSNPSGGRYECLAMPGAVADGTNVPVGTIVGSPSGCGSKQHLTWNHSSRQFSCTDDTLPPAPGSCPHYQYPQWNGSAFTCVNFLQPPTNCTGPKEFLQWDNVTKTYACTPLAGLTSTTSCPTNQYLTWNGSAFSCQSPSGKAEYAGNTSLCTDTTAMFYWAGKFRCGTFPGAPPIPPTCNGPGDILQYEWWRGYICTNKWAINYHDCWETVGNPGDIIGCGGGVAVGFCASGGGADCLPYQGSKYYAKPDNLSYSGLKCCSLMQPRWYNLGIVDINNVAGTGGGMVNSKNGYGNLAVCPGNTVVKGICTSDGDKRCYGPAAVSIECGNIYSSETYSTRRPNNQYTQYYNGDSDYASIATNYINSMGCNLTQVEGYGAWQICKEGEVLVGICGSGNNEDCSWGNKLDNMFNQGLCCPIR